MFEYYSFCILKLLGYKSFFGHYLGAAEGFNALLNINSKKYGWVTPLFMLISTWAVATLNPSILGMIETLGGPVIAMLLFLLPMYGIRKIPAMHKYRGALSNVFVTVIGLVALTGICFSLLA